MVTIAQSIVDYNSNLVDKNKVICQFLASEITEHLEGAESKIWHSHPVWFLEGNPIVGYSIEKKGVRLMFWSGVDFQEKELMVRGGKFKDASIYFTNIDEINVDDLERWLEKGTLIQWDYKNIVKRKGELIRLH